MLLKDHPALLTAVISAVLIAARLLAIARFDVSTAATILTVSGTTTAVAGTLLTLLPYALVLSTGFLAAAVFIDQTLLPTSKFGQGLSLALFVGATMTLVAAELAVLSLIVVVVAAVIGLLLRRSDHPEVHLAEVIASSKLLRVQASALLILMVLTPIVLQRPWLPVQEVSLNDGSVVVGYVLGDVEGELALMSDKDRTIRFVGVDDIKERSICSGPGALGGVVRAAPRFELSGSLVGSLLWGGDVPRYPRCRPSDPPVGE